MKTFCGVHKLAAPKHSLQQQIHLISHSFDSPTTPNSCSPVRCSYCLSLHAYHGSGHILPWVESLMRQLELWSLALPSGAALLPFFTPQTSWYLWPKHRSTLGHTDKPNLIFLILPRLFSSSGFRHKPRPPPFVVVFISPTVTPTALSFTLYPHPLIALCSSNLITTLVCWGFSHWLPSCVFF